MTSKQQKTTPVPASTDVEAQTKGQDVGESIPRGDVQLHSPEPWREDDNTPGREGQLWIYGADGYEIAYVGDLEETTATDHLSAERLVACVNACQGMTHPAADIAALRQRVADLESRLECGQPCRVGDVVTLRALVADFPESRVYHATVTALRTLQKVEVQYPSLGNSGLFDLGFPVTYKADELVLISRTDEVR